MLRIELLGELRVTVDGERRENPTSVKARLLLARLSASRGNLTREILAEEFWGDAERISYRRKAARALAALADAQESAGDLLGAADLARQQRELIPDELDPWKRLLRILDAAGDVLQAEAERRALFIRYSKDGGVPPTVLELLRVETPRATLPREPPSPPSRYHQASRQLRTRCPTNPGSRTASTSPTSTVVR